MQTFFIDNTLGIQCIFKSCTVKMLLKNLKQWNIKNLRNNIARHLSYVQGQEPEPKIREYFYYIDHEGMLFLDDARMKNFTSCFKEKKFLQFFFSRVRRNETKRYRDEFPFISPCGRERNYIRCDDLPIVFTHVIKDEKNQDLITYAHAGDLLSVTFQPDKIYMNPDTGRVYHPAGDKVGNIGLIRSKLAIELSRNFEFENGEQKPPTHFIWNSERLHLENSWVEQTIKHDLKT